MVPVTAPGPEISSDDQIKVHFIDVGQADSIYIQLPDHNDILIDAGDEEDGPVAADYLRQQGIDEDIELLIATHPHRDHIGGIPDVMAAFHVDEVLDSGLEADSAQYEAYSESINAEGCTWVHDDHQTFNFGDVQLQILTGKEAWDGVNNYSVVARLDCGQVEFLFPGDAEQAVEEMLGRDISAEVLKVGHHGSCSSTSFGFLDRVKPEIAVISAGAGNSYGHPHQETLSRLQTLGIKAYRTDWDGSIVITTDGERYWF